MPANDDSAEAPATQDAGASATADGRGSDHHEHRHHHRYRVRRERHRPSLLIPTLLILLGLLSAGLIITLASVYLSEQALAARQAATGAMMDDIESLKAERKELLQQLAVKVRGRVPGLRPILNEQVLNINQGLVKDVLFTVSGTADKQNYEYQVVLRNSSNQPAKVGLKLLLFNRFGVQIDEAGIGRDADGTLNPGEVSSHSGQAAADPEWGLPAYFMFVEKG